MARGSAVGLSLKQLIGVRQTWVDVKAERTWQTVYQNLTGKPIQVNIRTQESGSSGGILTFDVSDDNVEWRTLCEMNSTDNIFRCRLLNQIIPDGGYYALNGVPAGLYEWMELR